MRLKIHVIERAVHPCLLREVVMMLSTPIDPFLEEFEAVRPLDRPPH
jgi:hypothetical protein